MILLLNRFVKNKEAMPRKSSLFVGGIFFAIWSLLFIGGINKYIGSAALYGLFTAVFLITLISGFFIRISYGYLFIVVFLWLGFWLKLTWHLIFNYTFIEAFGNFSGSAKEWDEVLWVSIAGCCGLLVSRIVYNVLGANVSTLKINVPIVPRWYPIARKWIWFALLLISIAVAVGNVVFGVQQSGLVPRTIFPWPINALTYWLLSMGFALAVATLMLWDLTINKNLSSCVYVIFLEGLLSSVSLLSRGTYIFHAIPQVLALYMNRFSIKNFRGTILIAALIGGFLISMLSVTILRNSYFYNISYDFDESSKSVVYANIAGIPLQFVNTISGLVVDRWVGLEGVMALVAFPEKNISLFMQGLTEKSGDGVVSVYQRICNSRYQESMDASKFRFASLPGAVAFFYYTGSVPLVFLGMLIFGTILVFSERLVFYMTKNPLICSLHAMNLANIISQFGVAPRQILIHLFMLFCGFLFIMVLQLSGNQGR